MLNINDKSLHPRIRVEVGMTVNTSGMNYAKPLIGIEIDVPPELTTEEALVDLYEQINNMLNEVIVKDIMEHAQKEAYRLRADR